MTNLVYIVSSISKSVAFEWICEELNKSKYNLTFILLNNELTPMEDYLVLNKINCHRISYSSKKDLPKAIWKIRKILKQENAEIVHTHLFEASFIGLIAAKLAGVKRRIHTRHNATIHHDYFPKAVKYDKMINYLSTDIVSISQNVSDIIIKKERADKNKIVLIHHGFKLQQFENVDENRVFKVKQKHLQGVEKKLVLGVISRYIHWKGVQYIILAFEKFVNDNPEAHLVLCNASGPYKKELTLLLEKLPLNSYTEIEFEEDVFALYRCFDIFIHTPINSESEAFGQVYVESLASSVPSIFTLSGIACDFIKHKKNALVVPFNNSDEIYNSLIELKSNSTLTNEIINNGLADVNRLFPIQFMIDSLEKLYEKRN